MQPCRNRWRVIVPDSPQACGTRREKKEKKKKTIREPVSEREREKGREEGVLEVFRRKAHAYRRPPTEDYYSVD